MNIDWDSLWGGAKEAVQNAANDAIKVGVPAIQAGAEQWAIQVLQEQQQRTQATLDANMKDIMERDSSAIGSAISGQVQQSAARNWGPYVLAGVGALILLGVFIARK